MVRAVLKLAGGSPQGSRRRPCGFDFASQPWPAPPVRKQEDAPAFVKEMVAWGAGPRAGIYLILAAKARAILQGRYHSTTEDVRKPWPTRCFVTAS